MWAVIVVLSLFVPVQGGVAQGCSISRNDWDDIERFRSCIEEQGLEAWSPWVLHQAARPTGNPTVVHLLLQAGADPSARDDQGQTPLHQGVRNANPMVTRYLVDAGADLSARDNDGYTPLHHSAAWSGNGPVIKLLLDRGTDPLAESNDGRTRLRDPGHLK